jgi:hypothetical protein
VSVIVSSVLIGLVIGVVVVGSCLPGVGVGAVLTRCRSIVTTIGNDMIISTSGIPGWIVGLELGGIEVLTFVFKVFDALWDACIVAEAPFGFCTSQAWALVVLGVVSIPGVAVLERELAVPFPVGWFVDAMDVDMAALTQRNHVLYSLVSFVAVDVMQREFVLPSRSKICVKPFVWGSTADYARPAPAVEDGFFEGCWSHKSIVVGARVASRPHVAVECDGTATPLHVSALLCER